MGLAGQSADNFSSRPGGWCVTVAVALLIAGCTVDNPDAADATDAVIAAKPPGNFVEAAKKHSPDLIGLSALLTTTMEAQREVIQAFTSAGLRDSVKIMVGGAVVNQDWADEIGADAYGSDAIDGLNKAKVLLGINY